MARSTSKASIIQKRKGDRRKNYKEAELWHRDSKGGATVERRRRIRRQEDVERFKDLIWYQDAAKGANGTRRIILDRVDLVLRDDGKAKVVDLSGELCHADHVEVREIFDSLSRQGYPEVVLNLASLRHVDSAGLGLLVGLRLAQRRRQGEVRLTGVPGEIYRTMMNCRLQKILSIEPA